MMRPPKHYSVRRATLALSRRKSWESHSRRRLFAEMLEPRLLLTTVSMISPLANSHTAPVTTNAAVTFDQSINAATATSRAFAVHSMQRGQLVGSAATVSTAGETVTLSPTVDFLPGELVHASVTAAI